MQSFGKLRNIEPEELELMRSWRNAPNVRANMYTRHEISAEEHLAWWSRVQQRTDQKYFMYEMAETPLGIIGFMGIDGESRNSSWAFYASPDAPKGTGSRMEFLALEYAFEQINLNKLHCEVLAFNSPVIKMHQKFGFQIEGILREHHKLDDAFVDIYRLGLLSREWAEHRTNMFDKIQKFTKG
ncbi:UDP-4-amino-4,6-dideoxy-N-acetyl-beta-L-altrosamine N-acetyltransferase [Pseudomonas lini]|uniref:UDP-4-amino-4, 6-dideoxy-N-acetyl-beta-L-altrosamine N-acetyltransferase n=1 Tax=Pseudomonas lini TaxID=163011 RepID=UPI002780252C|nr:UDP-4-amino-4,6-dideoxy-N-acetyl-beta-L-altrosamine N-acetyltransferase [Pseudomonas lini]MDQ0125875.1 UDP-4-amino-4,6-dideoxy-N-acetyl-beta-L-altrosamine N-acetyltransferase [Pseudomonas lini]